MPTSQALRLFSLPLLLCLLLVAVALSDSLQPARAEEEITSIDLWQMGTKDELKGCFDEVARNLGLVEAAYYSYTLEFREVPESVEAMIRAGHLRPLLINPYSNAPVKYAGPESVSGAVKEKSLTAGDIYFRPDVAGGALSLAGLFLDPNNASITKWMQREIVRYYNEAEHQLLFETGASEPERKTRISMEHLLSGIEEYEIRFGHFPEDFEALKAGDMRVEYPNAFQPGRLMRQSESVSAGDFYYERIADDNFLLAAWGATDPTWFFASDLANFGIERSIRKPGWELVHKSAEDLKAMTDAGPLGFVLPTEFLLNKQIALEFLGWQIDVKRETAWATAHPDCESCGSTYVFWQLDEHKRAVCVDERSGKRLPDCCCEELAHEVETPANPSV